MARGRRESVWSSGWFLLFVLCLVAGAGFAFGRYVIGEAYLKQSAAVRPASPTSAAPPAEVNPPGTGFRPSVPSLEEPQLQPGETAPVAPEQEGPAEVMPAEPEGGEGPQVMVTPRPAPPKSPAPKPGKVSGGYGVQVGVFVGEENSRALVEEMRAQGFSASVKKQTQEGATVYRVVVGPYGSEEEARQAAGRLKGMGYDAFLAGEGR